MIASIVFISLFLVFLLLTIISILIDERIYRNNKTKNLETPNIPNLTPNHQTPIANQK